jgi:hypothetical protein
LWLLIVLNISFLHTYLNPHENGPFDAPVQNGLRKYSVLAVLFPADLKVIDKDTEKLFKSQFFHMISIVIINQDFHFFGFTLLDLLINLRVRGNFTILYSKQGSFLSLAILLSLSYHMLLALHAPPPQKKKL